MPDLLLPPAVRVRLGDDPIPGVDMVTTYRGRPHHTEERLHTVELRLTDEGAPIIEGYASTTGVWYDVWGGPPWGWREQIAPGAFKAALDRGDDTRLLVNHTGVPLARTKSGTLTLEEDSIGLRIATPDGVDVTSPAVLTLVSAMQRGDIDEMSFAFTVDKDDDGQRLETWNDDYTERVIRQVQLFDVAVVTYPANPATLATVHSDTDPDAEHRGMPLELAQAYTEITRSRRALR